MRLIGCIYKTELKNHIIGIQTYGRILYLHFPNTLFGQLKRYLYAGIYIDLDYDEEKVFLRKGKATYSVNFVLRVFRFLNCQKIQYYDYTEINNSLSDFLNSLGNIMFLDLEMTMPSYAFSGKGYCPDICQVGYVLVNGLGEEITRYNHYIQTYQHKDISKRTLDFLKISLDEFHREAIPYQDFYEEFRMVIENYHPSIVIFGKNDRLTLNQSFEIHKVKSLSNQIRYVNLCKLIQTYYHLNNEPGLFKLYQVYYQNFDSQVHDAFDDAYVTMKVFKAFKDDVDLKTNHHLQIKESF